MVKNRQKYAYVIYERPLMWTILHSIFAAVFFCKNQLYSISRKKSLSEKNTFIILFQYPLFRYKDRLEVYVLDIAHPETENDNEELSISVATKYLMPFEGMDFKSYSKLQCVQIM